MTERLLRTIFRHKLAALIATSCAWPIAAARAQSDLPAIASPADISGAEVRGTGTDLAELTRAVQAQVRMLEQLRNQNEELARTNQDLIRRIEALEIRAGSQAETDTQVTRSQRMEPLTGASGGVTTTPTDEPIRAGTVAGPSSESPRPIGDRLSDVIVETVPARPVYPPLEPNLPMPAAFANEAGPSFENLPSPVIAGAPESAVISTGFQPLPKSDLGPSPTGSGAGASAGDFFFGKYDNGFVLVAPKDPQKTPFAAKLNIVTQERYTGFSRQNEFWQPRNFPSPIRVNNRSTFDVNRAYIGFSGFAIDPRLRYSMIVATTSVVNVTYLLGTVGFQFDKAFGLYGGFNKVPGSREWLESFKHTLGSDRSMATTFFRPSMSPGVWITGEPLTDFHYYGMISNSINSFDQLGDRRSTQMAYSGSIWWEPLGSFGPGFSDEEFHESPVIRLGGSGLFTRQDKEPLLEGVLDNPENTILRLSNGIPVFLPGALAPGVSLLATDDRMLALDAGLKYRGFSLSGEYYFRLLNNFRTDKPLPGLTSVYDSGGYVQTSFALIPKRLEAFAKTSLVAGPFGSGNDYGGGLNWYVSGNRNWRITGEAIQVNRSPASNILTPYRTGQSGTVVLMQLVTDF
jgi:hypothetical protein